MFKAHGICGDTSRIVQSNANFVLARFRCFAARLHTNGFWFTKYKTAAFVGTGGYGQRHSKTAREKTKRLRPE